MARIDNLDVLHTDILDAKARQTGDNARADVARQILDRALIAVASVRLVERNLGIHILDHHILKARHLTAVDIAGSRTKENRVASVKAPEAVDLHILDLSSVHGSDGDGAAVGVEYGHILEPEVLELATGVGSELDAVGAASSDAVLYKNILAHAIVAVALEAI